MNLGWRRTLHALSAGGGDRQQVIIITDLPHEPALSYPERKRRTMDPTGCPNLYATDRVLVHLPSTLNDPSHRCTAILPVYWVFSMLICALRVATALYFVKAWREDVRKHRQRQAQGKGDGHKFSGTVRIPFVPILACISTVAHILLFVLAGVNVINIFNGGTPILMSFAAVAEGMMALLYLKKLIGLSAAIMRWHKVKGSHDTLNKPDLFLKLIGLTAFACFLAQLILFCIPPHFIGAAVACLTAIIILLSIGFAWQFQRLIWQLQATANPGSSVFIQPVLWKMRAQQAAGLLIGAPIAVLSVLVTTGTIDLTYGLSIFSLGFYRLLEMFFIFSRKRRAPRTRKVDDLTPPKGMDASNDRKADSSSNAPKPPHPSTTMMAPHADGLVSPSTEEI